jgi:hypothetical protein
MNRFYRNRANSAARLIRQASPSIWWDHGRMPKLTRRRDPSARQECWHVYYGDVRVGTIGSADIR